MSHEYFSEFQMILGYRHRKLYVMVQYRTKVSWQSRLETRFSKFSRIENRVEARVSSFDFRGSRVEFRGSSFEFRDTRSIFRGSRTEISRKRFNSRKQNNSDEQNNRRTALLAQTRFCMDSNIFCVLCIFYKTHAVCFSTLKLITRWQQTNFQVIWWRHCARLERKFYCRIPQGSPRVVISCIWGQCQSDQMLMNFRIIFSYLISRLELGIVL